MNFIIVFAFHEVRKKISDYNKTNQYVYELY